MFTTEAGKAKNGDIEIAYELTRPAEDGADLPTFLFIGGWGESGRTWGREIAHLAKRFPTLTYDRRGLGQSSCPEDEAAYTVQEEVGDLEALLAATGLKGRKIWPVCHSYGCHVIIHWLTSTPSAGVDKVALLTPTARAKLDEETPTGCFDEAALQRMNQGLLSGNPEELLKYSREAIPEGGASTEPLRKAIANLVPGAMSPQIAVWIFTHYYYLDLRPLLPRLEMPILAISGELDTTMRPAAGADLVARLKNARQVVVPQVGHLLHLTVADQINRLLEEFFLS